MSVQSDISDSPQSVYLGRYEVARRIAGGGMAEIYLGLNRGPSGLAEAVAIKCVRPELAEDRQFLTMLHVESQLAIQLDHPNVVHVYEIGEQDGQTFLAMEYLLGETLGALMKAAERQSVRVPCGVAARIIAEAARGLHYAHTLSDESGTPLMIVHRDVSPQNIFVCSEGVTKMLDFGIAKAATALEQTQAGVVKGKYAYLSPEQARGEVLDARSDVFSLGIVGWEFVSGERLFAAEHALASLHAVSSKPIPPLQRIRPDVPARLDAIVKKALSRKRDDRWQTAAEMADALDEAAFAAGGANLADVAAFVRKLVGPTIDKRKAVLSQLKRGSAELQDTSEDVASPGMHSQSGLRPTDDLGWFGVASTTVADLDEGRHEGSNPGSHAGSPGSSPGGSPGGAAGRSGTTGRGRTSYAQAGSALPQSVRFEHTPLSPIEERGHRGVTDRFTPMGGMTPADGRTPLRVTPIGPRTPDVPRQLDPVADDLPLPELTAFPAARSPTRPVERADTTPSRPSPAIQVGRTSPGPGAATPSIVIDPSLSETAAALPSAFGGTTPAGGLPVAGGGSGGANYEATGGVAPQDRPKLARNLDELRAQLAGKLDNSANRAPEVPALQVPSTAPEPDRGARRHTSKVSMPTQPAPKTAALAALRSAMLVTVGILIGAVVVYVTPKVFAPPDIGRLIVLASPLDVDVKIDGRLAGRGSARLDPAPAGPHEVEVVAPDGRGVSQTVTVFAGKNTEIRIELHTPPSAAPPTTTESATTR